MADLTFADSHNMVAYLEKSEDKADFAEIVNFLNASPISGPTTLVAYEIVHEEKGDSVEWTGTTAASLNAEQDSGNIIRIQSMATLNEPIPQGTGSGSDPRHQDTILGDRPAQTRDRPLSRVNTFGSGEDRMKLNELMEICTRLSETVLALENIKTAQNLEIVNLNKREDASKQGRNEIDQDEEISWFQEDAETQGRYGYDFEVNTASTSITTASINITTAELVTTASAPVTTVGVSVSTAEPSTPPTTTILIKDEDLTIAQTLMKMRNVKSKEKSKEKRVSSETTIRPTRGVIMQEASETVTRPIVPTQQQLDPKDKGKAHMQAEYEEEERIARQREEEDKLISWDNTQAIMEADYELAQRLQAEE
ncbi:hypothetical protein Tco_0842445 [Tanacetum coccineum]|uniref:Uncharacterized protein n=1 Tax=Tanacetum coccineum TaxID=301880 RepID=A0ABQ5B346_9ASTR